MIAQRFPIMVRNMRSLAREKTFILIILLMLFIILTLTILVTTMAFIFNPEFFVEGNLEIGVVGERSFFDPLTGTPKISITQFDNESQASAAFQAHDLDAYIVAESLGDQRIFHFFVPENPVSQSLVLSVLRPAFEKAEATWRAQDSPYDHAVWHHEIDVGWNLKGADIMYEVILGLLLPLLLMIPAFLIGNLFVDTVAQEFEEGGTDILFTAVSPWKYVGEYLLQGTIINGILVAAFLFFLSLRYSFIHAEVLIWLYCLLFGVMIMLASLLCVFVFGKKDLATLVYSFGILSLFLLSPFFASSPTFAISEMLLGNGLSLLSVVVLVMMTGVLGGLMHLHLRKRYY